MKKNILCVDDSKTILELLNLYLNGSYNIITAENGKIGIDKLMSCERSRTEIALILTDINMPEMAGPEFIKNLRSMQHYRFTPVIILTTEDESPLKYKVNFNGWIKKPFDSNSINEALYKVLNPIEYMKQKYSSTQKLDILKQV